jgi:hypothetical protein
MEEAPNIFFEVLNLSFPCFSRVFTCRYATLFKKNDVLQFLYFSFKELLNTGMITILYFIAFIVQLSGWSNIDINWSRGSNITAGVSFVKMHFI